MKHLKKIKVIQVLLFVATLTIISALLPRETKQSFEYSMGKPWSYQLLTAPFDIPIDLDSVSAKQIKDSINENFVKVYERLGVDKRQLTSFYKKMNTVASVPSRYKTQIFKNLHDIYSMGIVDNETYEKIQSGKISDVRVKNVNVIELETAINMFSVRKAYEHLDSLAKLGGYHSALSELQVQNFLEPNIAVDQAETQRVLMAEYQKHLSSVGTVQQGERIVDRGDIVTPQIYSILKSYDKKIAEQSKKSHESDYTFLGKLILVMVILIAVYVFLAVFHNEIFNNVPKITFIMMILTITVVCAFLLTMNLSNGQYLMPFTLLPIIIIAFFDSRTAFYVHLGAVLICTLVVTDPTEFVILQIIAGMAAIVSLEDFTKRSQLMRSALIIFVIYSATYAALSLVNNGLLGIVDLYVVGSFVLNAFLLSFSYMFVFLIERTFGFTSEMTLMELTDTNTPLLRRLSELCPGTFQHSMQVASIAAEAAHKIGANVQLVRAGALYHDIGKMESPNFFTENQRGVNPHEVLAPEQSAMIVIKHVTDGLALADKHKLPQCIKDLIAQHHGCGVTLYFYTQACNAHPDETIDAAPFRYPGPNPNSKEATVLMMADATEAASKSLVGQSPETISALVNRIINKQIEAGLFKDSPLGFRDIEIVKQTFIERLGSIYHLRVQYPDEIKMPTTKAEE